MDRYLGESIPKLGFGLMRLPKLEGETIDIEQVKEMVDLFMAAGFRYFDTAYGYNNGDSERAARAALVDRYPRDSFYLATKLPAWTAKDKEDAQQMFYTSLERTGAGYFDFYLLHNIGKGRLESFDSFEIWDFLAARKAEGLIKHLGFSCHASADFLDDVLTKHPEMEFVQLQINYADWESEGVQSRKCYEVARKHGKPVIIMEPVKGGTLADLPAPAAAPLLAVDPEASQASWALRFAASLEGLVTVLSGMSSVEQMKDNLAMMKSFRPFTDEERAALEQTRNYLASVPTVPCTGCSYCTKGCPQQISIPDVFTAYNQWKVYEKLAPAKRFYGFATRNGAKASSCVECGQCESVCPQSIHIIDELKNAAGVFDD